jgi:hypothetical protein
VLVGMRVRGNEQWFLTAGAALGESGDADAGLAARAE